MNAETKKAEVGEDWGRRDGSSVYFWVLGLVACFAVVEVVLRRVEMPVGLRAVLALVPVLPFVFVARAHWRMMNRGDELARHMAREVYVFAFYALLAVFICTDLLKTGGVLPDFAWKAKSLLYAMLSSLAVATVWMRWRYR